MDSFTAATKKIEDVVLPPVNEDDGTGSSGSCVVCKEDTSLPTVDEDSGTGSSDWHKHHSSSGSRLARELAANNILHALRQPCLFY
ncbi:hypothetical protein B0H14DRAFT_3434140 [Mycena olivaceomarginata]|nr:hypothetical protein B0H14DRAFT_3434140 [Mycena olivaceomarginata]